MIYIQSNSDRTLPHHFDCASAMYGAIEKGLDYRLTSFEEVSSGKFNLPIKNNLFIGSVEFMREVFLKINLNDVRLPKNSNRKSITCCLSEAIEIAKTKKVFIKPYDIKLFSGLVLDKSIYSCLNNIQLDTKVLMYDVFENNIESEWRIYVLDNKIIDSKNYSGDFEISPSYDYIREIIKENQSDFPISYTIDIGILDNGENVVVEYNDMWSIGNYGIPNDLYLKALKKRYFQIVEKI